MTAQLLDGVVLGQKLRAGFKLKAEELAAQGDRRGLTVNLVGEDLNLRGHVSSAASRG